VDNNLDHCFPLFDRIQKLMLIFTLTDPERSFTVLGVFVIDRNDRRAEVDASLYNYKLE
tara:strand:- start:1264 stop:1440 length:177 start_codon:yes stop_codon:yes gene_type:complete